MDRSVIIIIYIYIYIYIYYYTPVHIHNTTFRDHSNGCDMQAENLVFVN